MMIVLKKLKLKYLTRIAGVECTIVRVVKPDCVFVEINENLDMLRSTGRYFAPFFGKDRRKLWVIV